MEHLRRRRRAWHTMRGRLLLWGSLISPDSELRSSQRCPGTSLHQHPLSTRSRVAPATGTGNLILIDAAHGPTLS